MANEKFIAAHVDAYPADGGRVFILDRGTGRSEILPAPLFRVLKQADRFDTVAGLAEKLRAAGWEDDGSGFIQSAHRELVARGLLVPRSEFLASLVTPGAGTSTPPVTSMVIPTLERAAELTRCLEGFIRDNEKRGRAMDYLVIDDSRTMDQGRKTRGVLQDFASGGARVFYAGMQEKRDFLTELARAASAEGLPEEVMEFGLFADGGSVPTYGTSRNAALLATGGELVIMTDDDTACSPVDTGARGRALEITSEHDPTLLRYYADRGGVLAGVRTGDVDIVSSHEKLLGRSIQECRSGLGPDCSLEVDGVGPRFACALGRKPMEVSATMAGFWGDSGMGSPNAVVELTGESRELALRSRDDYILAAGSREVFRSVARYTVSDGTLFMTANSGVDNRRLLPPFFPVGRNEDGMFAMALRVCAESSLIGHVPFAIAHAPAETRQFPPGAFLDVTPRLADIVAGIIRSFTPSPWLRDPTERLRALGRHFSDLGGMAAGDFDDQVRTIWTITASHYIGHLEGLLDRYHGEPDYWADDVLTMIGNFKDSILHGSGAAPRDFLGTQPVEQATESCRRLVRQFGELLQWWPVIWGTAKRLREKGIRLAQPI